MAQSDRESKPQFSQPVRQITLMLIALGLTCIGAFLALPSVLPIFAANPYLNGVIIVVFFIGVIACFYQVVQLIGSVRWIENFASDAPNADAVAPQLLAPLASLLRTRGARMQVNATSTRSILDSVATRIDEAREITRYIVNMLIFLGLLGTFYGLATTVPAVVETIRSLAPRKHRFLQGYARQDPRESAPHSRQSAPARQAGFRAHRPGSVDGPRACYRDSMQQRAQTQRYRGRASFHGCGERYGHCPIPARTPAPSLSASGRRHGRYTHAVTPYG
jgi:hypothetical protein